MIAKHWKQILFCVVVFSASFAIHFLSGNFFPKTAGIIPDEYSFIQQAACIAQGMPLSEMGSRSSKFLYPLLLSPAFALFSDLEGQLIAVNFINSLLAASSVFPAFILSRRILANTRGEKFAYVFGFLAAFMPVTFYSIGFMAEPAAIAVGLWWLYVAYGILGIEDIKKRLCSVAGFAVFTYLLYALKEYYAVYFIAFAILLVIMTDRTCKSNTSIDVATKKNLIYTPILYGVVFVLCYALSQLLFFGSLTGNSYLNQLSGNSMLPHLKWLPLYLPVVLVHIIAAAGFIPLLTPIWKESRDYNQKDATFGLFVIIALFVMLLVVFLTVILREETVYATRMILRYYDLLLFASAILFVKKVVSYTPEEIKKALSNKRSTIIAVVVAATLLIFLGIIQYDNEGASLLWLVTIFNKGQLPIDGGAIDFVWIALVKAIVVAVLIAVFIVARKGKISGRVICAILCGFLCVAYLTSSAVMTTTLRISHEMSVEEMVEGDKVVEAVKPYMDDGARGALVICGIPSTGYGRFYAFSAESRYVALKLKASGISSYVLGLSPGQDIGADPNDNYWYVIAVDKASTADAASYGLDEKNLIADTKDVSLYYYDVH